MYWHIEADFICLIIMIALYYNMSRYDIVKDKQDKLFRTIAGVSIISIVIDIVASLAMDYATNWWIYQLLNMIYFISLPFLILLWFCYLRLIIFPIPTQKNSITTHLFFIPYSLWVLICLSNPFSALVFRLTADMEYSRGPLFACSMLLLIFYTIASFVQILIHRNKIIPKSRIFLFAGFYFMVIAGVYFQLSNPGWLVIYGAFTAMFIITYFYIQNRRTMTDSLTGLLARFSGVQLTTDFLEANPKCKDAALILTDLDNFKLINDSAGHRYGDLVLRKAAEACIDVFPPKSIISRLGGDEFLIFVSGYKDRSELAGWLSQLNDVLEEKLVSKENPVPSNKVTMSIGVTFFPEHGSNFPELYECADVALYQAKWQGKNKYVFYERQFQADIADRNPLTDSLQTGENQSHHREFVPVETIQKTMLIIDDSKISREVLTSLFCDEFIILRAEDTKTGLEQLRRYGMSITVILLDILMPGRSGLDFLIEKGRTEAIQKIPVIVISACTDKTLLNQAMEFGAVSIAEKPIRAEDLRRTVKKVIDKYGEGFWYSDRYQREFLNLANTGIRGGIMCVKNEPGHTIDFISNSLLKLLGYTDRQDFFKQVNGYWDNVIYPEDLEKAQAEIQQQVASLGIYTDLEYRLMRKDGSHLWVRDNGKIVDAGEAQSFIVGLCVDIDEIVSMKKRLEWIINNKEQ